MNDTARITLIALAVAVPVYFWLSGDANLPPERLYGMAAAVGVVAGVALNFVWKKYQKKGSGP